MDLLTCIETKVSGSDKLTVVRIAMFSKLLEKNLYNKFTKTGFDIIVNLYLFGGTVDKESMNAFIEDCYVKNYAKVGSENSIRNTLTLARSMGIVKRRKSNNWQICEKFMPSDKNNFLVYKGLFTDYAVN